MSDSTYVTWFAMRYRCNNPNNPAWKNYGGRGIKVCKRWEDYDNFVKDMGEKPKGMTIDRIDVNKGYTPKNCRWASRKEQARNTRSNLVVTHNGVTKCVSEWAEEYGIPYSLLYIRISKGWSLEKAVCTPRQAKGACRSPDWRKPLSHKYKSPGSWKDRQKEYARIQKRLEKDYRKKQEDS